MSEVNGYITSTGCFKLCVIYQWHCKLVSSSSHFKWENLLEWRKCQRGKGDLAFTASFSIRSGYLLPSLVRPTGDIWHYIALWCQIFFVLLTQDKQIPICYFTHHFPFLLFHPSGWDGSSPSESFLLGLLVIVKKYHLWPTQAVVRSSMLYPQKHLLVWQMACREVLCSCGQGIEPRYISFKRSNYSFWPFPAILPTPRALCVLWWGPWP